MNFTGILRLSAASLLALLCARVSAAPGEHEHLDIVTDLDFATMLDAALQQAPQALETPVREEQASASAAAGRSLVAGRPSLIYNLFDDRFGDDFGFRQQDIGLQLSLWRPGERGEAQAMGQHYREQVVLWKDYLSWQLAGRLRLALGDLQAADARLMLTQQAADNARRVHETTQRLVDAGSLAQLDALQTRTLSLEQQQLVLDAEAAMVDAERNYQVLTGLDRRPAEPLREILNPQEEIDPGHPLLRYLQSEVTLAMDNVTQAELDARGSPTLTLGTHADSAGKLQPTYDALLVSLNIPIGGKRLVQARTSGARREQVDAEVALRQSRIQLQAMLHEAEHGLFVNAQALPLAEERVTIADQRLAMANGAFETGELTLAQVLVAVQDAASAREALAELQLARDQLTSEYNQLIGVLP